MAKITEKEYKRWLKAAYTYYWGTGEDSGMSDAEWDFVGRQINPDDWDELRGTQYDPGQSLFWMKQEDYPAWAK